VVTVNRGMSAAGTITVDELRLLRSGASRAFALIDVREASETNQGHIPGASTVPLGTVPFRGPHVLPNRSPLVVATDDGDGRAGVAVRRLRQWGYDAVELAGGLGAWRDAGERVERGRNVPSKRFGETLLDEDDLLVDPQTVATWQREGRPVRLLDVRTPAEHRRECIPGATNAPGLEVVGAVAESAAVSGRQPVVVHCTGRTRSIVAARTLRLLGFENVRALENGTMGWILAGLEVERGADRSHVASVATDDRRLRDGARDLATQAGVEAITPAEVAALLEQEDRTRYLFDVRTDTEVARGTAPRASHVPSGQLVQQLDDHVLVAPCDAYLLDDVGGVRAWLAALWLKRLGVDRVAVIDGGLDAWQAADLDIVPYSEPEPLGLDEALGNVELIGADTAARQLPRFDVVSVDHSSDFVRAHLPGARWVPAGLLEVAFDQWFAGGDRPVLVTCADGRASSLAGASLRKLGVTDVRVLEGGLRAWVAAGHDLETGPGDMGDPPIDVMVHPLVLGEDAMWDYLSWEIELD
jgi:rhodanese-related sulfurtransferase